MLQPVTDALSDKTKKTSRLITAITTSTALSVSLVFHGALPYLGALIPEHQATSRIEFVATADPALKPVAEEEKEGPSVDPEPEGEEADSEKDAPSGEPDVEEASEPAPAMPEPEPEPVTEPEPAPEPEPIVEKAPPPKKIRQRSKPKPRMPSLKELRALKAAERMERIRAAKERSSKQRASRSKRSGKKGGKGKASKGKSGKGGGEGGGSAHAAGKKGKIDPVYACTKDGLGKKVDVRYDRPIDDWVTVVPTVLMPFRTRPGLDDYLGGVSQIVSRKRRGVKKAGPVEFALPAEVVQLGVDGRKGVRVAIGHTEGRCLVGMRYTRELFPITLYKVPMRVVDGRGNAASALATIKLYKDASFDLVAEEGSLPFTSGALENAEGIRRTIEQHYGAARAFKEVAGWFGVDVGKMARERRVERAKKRAQADRGKRGKNVARRR
jgi:outer membrane biosynthesis protein TonB